MFDRSSNWGITHILVLLLILTLAPFIVLEVYRGAEDVRQRRDALTQQTRNQAAEAALVTDDFIGFTQRFLASIAGARSIQSLDPAGSEVILEAVRAQNPNYESVFLFDAEGLRLASTVPPFGDLEAAQWPRVREALTGGRMTVSEVVGLPGTDRSVVVLAYPVSAAGGRSIGVIGVALNIGRLSTVVGYPRLRAGSVVLLAQQDGSVIAASSDPGKWVGRTLTRLAPFGRGALPGRAGTTRGSLPDGQERLVAYQPLDAAPWLMLAAIPQAELDSALRQSLVRISEAAALAVIASVLLAWMMLRRLLVPIRMLSDGAVAFASGLLDRRIPLRRRDELGALADALNGMASSLQQRLLEDDARAQALLDLNRLQTEFVATASHELRTPVTAIRTYAEALLRPDIDDEEIRRECLSGIDHGSQRLVQLVRTLLDVSRIDSGQIAITLDRVDAAAAVRVAVAQSAPEERVRIVVRAPADLPCVRADAERLEDVLANLIGNAFKFSPQGAPVTVELRRSGTEVTVAVRDAGVGISQDESARIFDRFYQVQRGTGRQAGGSGLGLYIARAYVVAMGGRISVESVPGRGATFFVVLPVAVNAGEPHTEGKIDGTAASTAPSGR